jgi:hypothetical protein
MASNLVLITSGGLQSINDASPDGIMIDVAYYVPVYDYRIDPNVSPVTTASPSDITTVASAGDMYPQGEIFWKSDLVTNTLSLLTEKYIISASGVTLSDPNTILNPVQKSSTQITLGNTFPRAIYWKTADVDAYYDLNSDSWISDSVWIQQGSLDGTWGPGGDYAGQIIPADLANPGLSFIYPGVSYNSVITTGTDRSANFRVVVTSPNGTIKFNKLGLYAVKKIGSGQLVGSPFLFAEVIIPEPQIVGNDVASGKMGELVIDFQLDTKTVTSAFDNLIYSTSGDYWERVSNEEGTYGLAYDGSVYIANRLATDDKNTWISTSADGGVAKLFVSTFEYLNGPTPDIEMEKPQACLQYVTQQTNTTSSKRIRTTFRTTSAGNFEVDMYGACVTGDPIYSITPKHNDEFGIGNTDYRWRTGFFSRFLSVGMGSDTMVNNNESIFHSIEFYVDAINEQIVAQGMNYYCYNEVITNYIDESTTYVIFDKFFTGNLRANNGMPLYIRSAQTNNSGVINDTDMWLMAGNWNATKTGLGGITQWNSTNVNHGSDNDLVASSILDTYRTRAGSEAIFAEMVAHKGGLYLTGNGYIYMMGSAVFMEHPMPFVDDYIRLGVEDGVGEAGTPLAFRSVATHQLVNAGRDIKISSSLIPSLGDGFVEISVSPSLGSADNWFNFGYFSNVAANSIVSSHISASNGDFTHVGTLNLDVTGTAVVNYLDVTSIRIRSFTNSYNMFNIIYDGTTPIPYDNKVYKGGTVNAAGALNGRISTSSIVIKNSIMNGYTSIYVTFSYFFFTKEGYSDDPQPYQFNGGGFFDTIFINSEMVTRQIRINTVGSDTQATGVGYKSTSYKLPYVSMSRVDGTNKPGWGRVFAGSSVGNFDIGIYGEAIPTKRSSQDIDFQYSGAHTVEFRLVDDTTNSLISLTAEELEKIINKEFLITS